MWLWYSKNTRRAIETPSRMMGRHREYGAQCRTRPIRLYAAPLSNITIEHAPLVLHYWAFA
jgi:hypothetical protein